MLKRVLKRAHRMGFTFQVHDLDDLNEIKPNTNYFVAVVLNNTALTTSTRSNPGHLVPCGSEHEDMISFSQPLSTNLTNAILLFVLFLVMSSI